MFLQMNNNTIVKPASAITRNKAFSIIGSDPDPIDTVTFVDGLKRIIQAKKEADVNGGYGMVVSGKVVFDSFGRVIKQGQPVFETYNTAFSSQLSAKNPTLFSYDILDRTTKIIAPDNATTLTAYGFGSHVGYTHFMNTVVDPENNKKEYLRDVDDRIVSVIEYNKGASITTQYIYDAMGQITNITDNKGNTTAVEYNLMGWRTKINNPDTGTTVYDYDANGNLTSKLTANYQPGKEIRYEYVFNRLKKIVYPESPPVLYEYGSMGDQYNRAGRIKKVTDESGEEERYYGKLGEVIKEVKRVNAHTPPVSNKKFTTDYVFDSFGRMLQLTYPDGETLKYLYDHGGLLKGAYGDKAGLHYDYIKSLLYDEFGQRTKIDYGNSVTTNYTYNPLTRRLATLITQTPDGRFIQNLFYRYDLVGNVLSLTNSIAIPTNTALPAGPVAQAFQYDDLYQLTNANGQYTFGPGKKNLYTNKFSYDTIGNMMMKEQVHKILQPSLSEHLPKETNYALDYIYGSPKPHAVTDAGDKLYSYDPAGNMTGWEHKQNGTRRTIIWNEENRVKEIDDNGSATYFLYDDSGERVVKRGQHGESIYINRFYAVRNGELGTKHVFAGETRVLSKLVKTPPTVDINPGIVPSEIPGQKGILNALGRGKGNKFGIFKRLDREGVPLPGTLPVEKDQFYYHGDHLGSSNMITDIAGAVYQHLEYFPYGETWIEEGGSYGGNTPGYKFTGKELDPETGLYYYGARYYEPVLSRWISADQALGKYLPTGNYERDQILPGMGGIYNPFNLALYSYGHQNPVRYFDPDGNASWPAKSNEIRTGGATGYVGYFGYSRIDEEKQPQFHGGADVLGKTGDPIYAFEGGKVIVAADVGGKPGKMVTIQHTKKVNGKEVNTYRSSYMHLSKIDVKKDDVVKEGQDIGEMGNTGNAVKTPTHLHFQIKEGGKTVDPGSKFGFGDRAKQFFKGLFSSKDPMFIPETNYENVRPQQKEDQQ